jgi:hypothetical protein
MCQTNVLMLFVTPILTSSHFPEVLSHTHTHTHTHTHPADALDELHSAALTVILRMVTRDFPKLPDWVRLYVTSREEPAITKALAKFQPQELRVDEYRNRQVTLTPAHGRPCHDCMCTDHTHCTTTLLCAQHTYMPVNLHTRTHIHTHTHTQSGHPSLPAARGT